MTAAARLVRFRCGEYAWKTFNQGTETQCLASNAEVD